MFSNTSFKNKVFIKVENVEDYLDGSQNAICSIYNSQGGILVLAGRQVPDHLRKHDLYILTNLQKSKESMIPLKPSDAIRDENIPVLITDSKKYNEKKKKLINTLGKDAIATYEDILYDIDFIFNSKMFLPENISRAKRIVDSAFNNQLESIATCVQTLRDTDTYIYSHSISVFLLFAKALKDFRNMNSEVEFYDTFKQKNNNINFNNNSIKSYCIGALLHDYGKTKINPLILNKEEPLTPEDFREITKHPLYGVEEVQKAGVTDGAILELIGNHHPGYKTFLHEHVAPLSQILNIIDIYDACRSDKPYRHQASTSQALQILLNEMQLRNWDFFIFSNLLKKTIRNMEMFRSSYSFES
ncbi:MAG: HD domain-containing protein [Spirochaetales bacterium]|nr:HD domain-containing protein [Spirochaetales bacterium]